MALYILAAIILLPLVEISVFIWIGGLIGVLPTVLLTVLTAVAGMAMLRHQGLSLVMRMQSELDAGRTPGSDLMHGAMIVIASLCLLIPGFVTDTIGLLLFVPPLREALARFIISRADVVIVDTKGTYRRQDGVVDLDEADWSPADRKSSADGDPKRISPWTQGDEQS